MKVFSAAALLPNRTKRPGYEVRKGFFIEDGAGQPAGASIVDGLVIAVDESVDHERRIAEYRAMTAEHFAVVRQANPHLGKSAWFFKYETGSWLFVGFGSSLDSLLAEGDFAAP